MKTKRLLLIASIVGLLLLIPLVAMQFTDEVNWTFMDFLVAAILLMSTGLGIDFIIIRVKRTPYRIVLTATLLVILFLIWAELAVGIFGTPLSGH